MSGVFGLVDWMDQSSPELLGGKPVAPKGRRSRVVGCLILLGIVLLLGGVALVVLTPLLVNKTLQKADETRTKSDMMDIKMALKNFQLEYSSFPVPLDSNSQKDLESRTQGNFLAALLGTDAIFNNRGIKFVDFKPATKDTSGLVEKQGETQLLDKWGEMYYVILDTNRDGKVADPETLAELNVPIAIYSSGPDRDPKTWGDNVRNWR